MTRQTSLIISSIISIKIIRTIRNALIEIKIICCTSCARRSICLKTWIAASITSDACLYCRIWISKKSHSTNSNTAIFSRINLILFFIISHITKRAIFKCISTNAQFAFNRTTYTGKSRRNLSQIQIKSILAGRALRKWIAIFTWIYAEFTISTN